MSSPSSTGEPRYLLQADGLDVGLRRRLAHIIGSPQDWPGPPKVPLLARPTSLLRENADCLRLVRLIAPHQRETGDFRLLLIEQTRERTAAWIFERISADELIQLASWFRDQQNPVPLSPDHFEEQRASIELQELCWGNRNHHWLTASKSIDPPRSLKGLLSGSFNPLHDGHRQLKKLAELKLDGPVHYELSVVNAEKPPLDYISLHRRLRQFEEDPVLLLSSSVFVDKSDFFSDITFVVGADTAVRILDARFYADEKDMLTAMKLLHERNCRFLVAPRRMGGHLLERTNIEIPKRVESLFEFISADEFCLDISSSELRRDSLDPFDWLGGESTGQD